MARQAPVAGPSRSKPTSAPDTATTKPEPMKADGKLKQTASISDKPKERNNTGKLNFFTKAKDVKASDIKKVKKEDSTVDLDKKMFFTTRPIETAVRASSNDVEKESEKESGSVRILPGYWIISLISPM